MGASPGLAIRNKVACDQHSTNERDVLRNAPGESWTVGSRDLCSRAGGEGTDRSKSRKAEKGEVILPFLRLPP